MVQDRDLSVAISGGGHRATVFGLGALLALSDTKLNRRTTSISSVSGGSITNAVAMLGPDYAEADGDSFAAHIAPALHGVATYGVLLKGARATKTYLRMVIVTALLGVVGLLVALITLITHTWVVAAIAGVVGAVGLVLFWLLFRQRSVRTERAIDTELLGNAQVSLAAVKARKSSVHHVICTTELQTGEPFYFTNRAVYAYRYGASMADIHIPLATAVQASACVPGSFAPRVIPLSTLGVHPPIDRNKVQNTAISSIVVEDGGIYDNMSDQWEYGFRNRKKNWADLAAVQPNQARFLVVVNGSGGWNNPKPIGPGGFNQELQGLLRSMAVQYDVSTADRRQALYSMFTDDQAGTGDTLDGVFVQITDSPYRYPTMFSKGTDAFAVRAREALRFLADQGYTEHGWEEITKRTSGTATTLAALGPDLTAELLEHGYLLTMVALYVLDNKGALLPVDKQRLQRLCQ